MPCAFSAAAKPSRSMPLGQPDGVLRPDRGASAGEARNGHDIAEAARVALGDLVARRDFVLEDLQFLDQDRRLHGVEPRRSARGGHCRICPSPGRGRERCAASSASPASSVKIAPPSPKQPSGLAGKKLVAVSKAERAEAAALVACAEAPAPHRPARTCPRLSAIARDRVMVGALPEQIDRNHRFRLEAEPLGGGDAALAAKPRSILKVASSTSTKTGVAPVSATTSPVAQNVKDGQITASPRADASSPSAPSAARRCRSRRSPHVSRR